nr:hypothetical protein [Streptomyces sp. alain-838]
MHEEHDEAVRLHAMVLEAEAGRITTAPDGRDTLWRGAAAAWGRLLERPEFRRHIAHRIGELDDPRLGGHSADDFLTALPRLLVSPFRDLAADPDFRPRLAPVCTGWAEYAVFTDLFAGLFEEMVEETVQEITDGLRSANAKKEAGLFGDAEMILRREVLPAFDRIGELRAFVSDWRYDDVSHAVAVGVGNLAVAMLGHHRFKAPTRRQKQTVVELAEKAYEIAPEAHVRAFAENWDVIYEWSRRTVTARSAPARSRERSAFLDWVGCWLAVLTIVGLVVLWTVKGWEWAAGAFLGLGFVVAAAERIVDWCRQIQDYRNRRRFRL